MVHIERLILFFFLTQKYGFSVKGINSRTRYLSLKFGLPRKFDDLLTIWDFKAVGFVVSGHVVDYIESSLGRPKIRKFVLEVYELLLLLPLQSTLKLLLILILLEKITVRIFFRLKSVMGDIFQRTAGRNFFYGQFTIVIIRIRSGIQISLLNSSRFVAC